MMCHAIQQTDMAVKDVEAQRSLENAQTAQSSEDYAAGTDAIGRAVRTAPPAGASTPIESRRPDSRRSL